MRARFQVMLLLLSSALSSPLAAQEIPPPSPTLPGSQPQWPAWEQLSSAQRQVLVSQLRERWNADPAQRGQMMQRAQRWHDMTPEQREQARLGMHRYEGMSPEQRAQARALFEHMRDLPPSQRKQLHDAWKSMTPQQREDWVRTHPPQPHDTPE